ncbi:MAG: endonuclease/exonuclease/phosphatase family protein [Opitutales bacterium]|nr:endonuclease/exonuclease/phosphatase family protein [Opitutales bacterium]MCH8539490.1 endonuclease/exonuclease/phosphatase family protein [Opitutales bacterium]
MKRYFLSLPLFLVAGLTLLRGDVQPVAAQGVNGEDREIRVATFNLYNYGVMDRMFEGQWRSQYPKPEEEKTALRNIIREVRPEVLAIQEIGGEAFLEELRNDLREEGIDYPYGDVVQAVDEVRKIGFLAKIEPVEVRAWTELDFAYFGERELVKRGLLEVVFPVGPEETWSLYVVHLKSKWTERPDDPQAEQKRVREAEAVRNHILASRDPAEDFFLIAGDVNDLLHSSALRRLRIRGEVQISEPLPARDRDGLTWTQRWEKAGLYSRIDYLLVSPAMRPWWTEDSAVVYDGPDWAKASDHRMVYADFRLPSE